MATSHQHTLILSLLLVTFLSLQPSLSFRPSALLLTVRKDASSNQYLTTINQRTPLIPVKLVLDLGGQFQWVDCDTNYVSSTYRPARCRSAQCSLARANGCGQCFSAPKPGCNNNTCGLTPDNTITRTASPGELAQDIVSIVSTNGRNPGPIVTVPKFLFSCAPNSLLEGLAPGSQGMAGLGRTKISLPSMFSSAFSFDRKFAICLSTSADGVVFFGDGPYSFLPGIDVSSRLTYTKLLVNKVSTASAFTQGDPSSDYFIGVKSIEIGDKPIKINSKLLSINSKGIGGTKISTVNPYTVLETSIFKSFTAAFIKEAAARNITQVAPTAPFKVCFSPKNIFSTRIGPSVPTISLVMESKEVVWSIFGANSMVQVNNGALCLGFIDGGVTPTTSVVIGGLQLTDTLFQFDLARSRLGFSGTLLGIRTTCANFNFTSIA